jgi:hypothetical protein
MDWLTKQKTYIWAIVVLVLINIATLVTLWLGRPAPPPIDKNGRPDNNNFLRNELGLNNDQENKFQLLRKSLFDSMDVINKQIWTKKMEIHDQAFNPNPDTQKVNNLLGQIASLQVLSEKLLFNHFSGLKNILSPGQLIQFNKIISRPDMVNGPRNPGEFPPPGQPAGMPPHPGEPPHAGMPPNGGLPPHPGELPPPGM